jgi:hypothetical protein
MAYADEEPWPLFVNQDTLQVRIEGPLRTLAAKRSDTEYLDGTLSYVDASGEEQLFDVKLRARGKYRRKKETCQFPPVRLNFKKKQVMGTEFAGQDKLKLVTYCDRRNYYEQYVLKEYLAYKILNSLTEYSFRVRLLRVTWIDTDRGGATRTNYAFLIEDEDLLAQRIGAEPVEVRQAKYSQLDAEHATFVTVFQYLIGNTDFSMVAGALDDNCCHNIVLFSMPSADRYLTVPYDFDFSGLVNARYAEPNPKLPIKRVVRRLYRGVCENNNYLDATLDRFRENEDSIRHIVSSLEGLDDKTRTTAQRYLDEFYRDIENPRAVERNLVRSCSSGR